MLITLVALIYVMLSGDCYGDRGCELEKPKRLLREKNENDAEELKKEKFWKDHPNCYYATDYYAPRAWNGYDTGHLVCP